MSGMAGYQQLPELMKKQQGGFAPRRYDICMVFKYKVTKMIKFEETTEETQGTLRNLRDPVGQEHNKMQAWKQRREALLKQMKNCGLNLFCYYSRDRDEVFCKIGADADKLCVTAARMKYKLQLKPEYLSAYAEYRQDFRGRSDRGNQDRRHYSQMYERHAEADDNPDEGAIFSTRDKIMIIHHIITSKDKDCAGINIGLLKSQESKENSLLQHYFPLHEERRLHELGWKEWKQWIWMGSDHTHKVRDYFGDKVAFYYLWMSFYWKWLAVPGLIGAVLQILDVCFRTPDNITAVPFCIFLAIWTSFLPHFWRRQEAKYAIAWGTFDMVPELEPCRPEHTGEPRINPVTAQVENYYPWQKRMWKYMFSIFVIIVTGVILMFLICLLLFARHKLKDDVPMGIAGWQFVMAIFVEVVNAGLTSVAKYLTNEENHRTQSEHDTHLLAKVFAFKFVNSYFVLYYIAFFKQHAYLFGSTLTCIRNDCLLDLQLALAIFMLVRLFVQNMYEFLAPKFKMWYRSFKSETQMMRYNLFNPSNRLEQADMSAGELQSKREPYDPFLDFDDTLITHGYATLFAVSSPWVCTATLLWIMVETVLDVKNLTETTQRPLPIKMRTNEPWDTAFDIYGILATITNIVLLVFASKEYEGWTFTEKLMLFILLIHMTTIAKLVIKFIFPEVPRSVALLHLKQANMVHRCLENIKVEPQQDFSLFRQHGADNFEIMEQDQFDDDEVEPELNLTESRKTMMSGLAGALDKGLVLILCLTLGLTLAIAVALFIYNGAKGKIH
jgi:hypothetical protein